MQDDQLKQYVSDLKTFASRAFPSATRQTINRAAFSTRKGAQENIRTQMTTRSRFSVASVLVEQAKGSVVRNQEAIVGSIAEYLETQEFGGVVAGGGKDKPIPTSYSAGQGREADRTRMPRPANKLKVIQLKRRTGRFGKRRARNAAAVRDAAAGGNKYIFMDLGRRQGIFRVTNGKRKPKVQMVWDLSQPSVLVPANPWLAPATEQTQKRLPQFYADALRYELRKHRVLGY